MAEKKSNRAEGGQVEKGTEYLVGDKSPEKFTPVDDTPQGKTIDERMADLLADHKRMGAR